MPSMYSDSLRAFLKPIVPYLDDPEVNEVLVNGPTEIWIEKRGKLARVSGQFTEEGLAAATRNIAQFVGRVLNDERPQLDARLPDGSRIHVVLPPVARRGTTLAIRKFTKDAMSMTRLIELDTMSEPLARFVEALVKSHLNIIISGGSGSGKTSLLNVLSTAIAPEERIVTIEDSAELQLQQPQIISFESRPPDKFGKGEVTLADLLNSALRLRPDRILVGEVRGGEAFSLLQAMNTGHSGSLATTHANTPIDTLRRIESLCLMSSVELPMVAVRAQVASAVNIVVTCERISDGSRKVTYVSEVLPLNERGEYRVQDLFVYTPIGKGANGQVIGYHAPTGVVPTFLHKLRAAGFTEIDEAFFDPSATYGLPQPAVIRADNGPDTKWVASVRNGTTLDPAEFAAALQARAQTPSSVETASEPAPAAPAEPPVNIGSIATPPEPIRAIRAAPEGVTEPPVARPAARASVRLDEPTIQISADLLSEIDGVVKSEPTRIVKIPIQDEKTDPHIRLPTK